MIKLDLLHPNKIEVIFENKREIAYLSNDFVVIDDTKITFKKHDEEVDVYLFSKESLIKHVYLYYEVDIPDDYLIFGDALERGYGDLSWHKKNDQQMFWYLFVNDINNKNLLDLGVKVRPSSIVSYKIIENELRVDLNVSSGGSGVNLDGRTLLMGTFIYKEYRYIDLYSSMKDFVSLLMKGTKMLQTSHKIYGFNNWYYAYGKSSYSQIIDDTKLLFKVTKGNRNRPYMVIDDCWSKYPCDGPWIPNDDFKDMKKLADEIKSFNIHPGIWVRPLRNSNEALDVPRHPLNKECFDPTTKEAKKQIYEDISRIVNWGYELIKFDYLTWDIYQLFAFQMPEDLCEQGWRFKDNHYTNAEIIIDIYKTIRKASKGAILIGCNTISHLIAGLVEINRVGDDTSGYDWSRTRKFGVNTLAFRMIQNDIFYTADADCVGIMGEKISWKQNKLWLDLLAKSHSPLFISCDPYLVTDEIKNDLKEAFKINEIQENDCKPISWLEENYPSKWMIDNQEISYNWYLFDDEERK